MTNPIPFPTGMKPDPGPAPGIPVIPEETKQTETLPELSARVKSTPKQTKQKDTVPDQAPMKEEIPDATPEKQEMPATMNMENVVEIAGQQIELKPTKLSYFRNKTAAAYSWLKLIPLTEFLTYGKGVLDEKRDADQILFDFLVAAFDDVDFVTQHYNEMTAADVDRIVKIFGRINLIDEREEAARKNREAQAAKR